MFFIKITDGRAKLFRGGRKTGNVRAKYCLFGGKTLFYACKIYCVMIKYLLIYVKTGIGRCSAAPCAGTPPHVFGGT